MADERPTETVIKLATEDIQDEIIDLLKKNLSFNSKKRYDITSELNCDKLMYEYNQSRNISLASLTARHIYKNSDFLSQVGAEDPTDDINADVTQGYCFNPIKKVFYNHSLSKSHLGYLISTLKFGNIEDYILSNTSEFTNDYTRVLLYLYNPELYYTYYNKTFVAKKGADSNSSIGFFYYGPFKDFKNRYSFLDPTNYSLMLNYQGVSSNNIKTLNNLKSQMSYSFDFYCDKEYRERYRDIWGFEYHDPSFDYMSQINNDYYDFTINKYHTRYDISGRNVSTIADLRDIVNDANINSSTVTSNGRDYIHVFSLNDLLLEMAYNHDSGDDQKIISHVVFSHLKGINKNYMGNTLSNSHKYNRLIENIYKYLDEYSIINIGTKELKYNNTYMTSNSSLDIYQEIEVALACMLFGTHSLPNVNNHSGVLRWFIADIFNNNLDIESFPMVYSTIPLIPSNKNFPKSDLYSRDLFLDTFYGEDTLMVYFIICNRSIGYSDLIHYVLNNLCMKGLKGSDLLTFKNLINTGYQSQSPLYTRRLTSSYCDGSGSFENYFDQRINPICDETVDPINIINSMQIFPNAVKKGTKSVLKDTNIQFRSIRTTRPTLLEFTINPDGDFLNILNNINEPPITILTVTGTTPDGKTFQYKKPLNLFHKRKLDDNHSLMDLLYGDILVINGETITINVKSKIYDLYTNNGGTSSESPIIVNQYELRR